MYNKTNRLKQIKKIATKKLLMYKIYYFSFFFALGAFLPLYPIYLNNVAKISEGMIGIVLSINPLLSIAFQPIWGIINQKFRLDKKIVLLSIVMVNFAIVAIMLSSQLSEIIVFMTIYSLVIVFTSIYGIFVCSIGPIQDSLTVMYTKKYGFKYGDVRIWGSIGYALCALLTGKLVSLFGYNVVIIISCIFYLISFITFLKLKQVKSLKINKQTNKENSLLSLFKNKTYVIFLVFAALSIGVLSGVGNYLFLWIKQNGGSEDKVGITTSLIVGIEILTMIIVLKLNTRINELNLVLGSIIFQIPVLLVFMFSKDLDTLIWILVLRGISQGMFVPVLVNLISSLIPSQQMSSGIILYSALSIGLTGFLTSIIGGFIIESFSYFVLFTIILILVQISLIFGFILRKIRKQIIIKL